MNIRTRIALVAAGMLVALALAACGGDDDDPAPADPTPGIETPAPTPTEPPVSEPETGPSGIRSVDLAINAIEQRDVDALIALLLFAPEACVPSVDGLGGPPLCEGGEANGTLVDVVPMASCEGYWVREQAAEQSLQPIFDGQVRLYAVYRNDDARIFERLGEYSVVLEVTGGPNGPQARDLIIDDEGIVGVNHGCGQNPEQYVQFGNLTDAIVEPPDVRTQ